MSRLLLAVLPLALLAAVRARCAIVTVHGVSMAPTLEPGERVLVVRRRRVPRGSIVAARFPESAAGTWSDASLYGADAHVPDWVVKRVAAVAGDRVDGGTTVPAGHVWLLGDGSRSMDSRHWGPVPVGSLRGVMLARLGRREP